MSAASQPVWLRIERIAAVLRRLPAGVSSWLSSSERERYAGLRVAPRANQYLSGHWLTREGMAQRHGGQPQDWSLRERRSLPPQVANADRPCFVSISHSGEWIAAAIAEVPLGIDLEQRRPRAGLLQFQNLLRAVGDPEELEEDKLLQRWVIKEAWVKRHGFSALPERLSTLQLRRSQAADADLRLWCESSFHFALCSEAPGAIDSGDALSAVAEYWLGVDTASMPPTP